MTTKFEECEGCFVNHVVDLCALQIVEKTINCPCTTCLVKVTCRSFNQFCQKYISYENEILFWGENE
jgi:hypothetical protein